jgi:hypothetical protein
MEGLVIREALPWYEGLGFGVKMFYISVQCGDILPVSIA